MEVHQVYRRHPEFLQRTLGRLPDIFRIAVDSTIILQVVAELRGNERLFPGTFQPLSDELLVVVVDVGRVPEGTPAPIRSVKYLLWFSTVRFSLWNILWEHIP